MASFRGCCVVLSLLFLGAIHSQDDEDRSIWEATESRSFGIAQPELSDTLLDINTTSKLLNTYESNTREKVFVLDNLLNTSSLTLLRGYITFELGAWKFSLHEPYEGDKEVESDNIPWINELDCIQFGNSVTGRTLQKAVMDVSGSESIYYPYRVRGKILRRGDSTKLFSDAKVEDNEYSLLIFLNEKWGKNDYGELYLYDQDREIFGGAVPKYGRTVIWQSSIPYLTRPPSMAFTRGQFLLHVQFSKSKDKVFQGFQNVERARADRVAVVTGDFVGTNKPVPESIDVKNNFVGEYKTKKGKRVVVIDNLYSKEDLDKLRVVILHYGLYYYDDSDGGDDNDNVQWIAGFSIEHYIQSRLWNITRRVTNQVSGKDTWFPYDVSCNLIRSADHTRIHTDCSPDEDEWTFLIYLNPDMEKNDYGETVFYEQDTKNPEIVAEVRPKYGRAVLFQGIIPHSARPPSSNYTHARLTFVAKLSVNEVIARTKAFQEEMRHFTGVKYQQMFLEGNVQIPQPLRVQKYPSEDDNSEQAELEDKEENEPEVNKPEEDKPEEDEPEEDEPELNDPVILSLESRLREIEQVPNLAKLRELHRELIAKHGANREALRHSYAKVL